MKIYTDFPLSQILYYKIGGPAKVLLEVSNKNDFFQAVNYIKDNSISKILPIGIGSNLLMSDNGFDGAVIHFSNKNVSVPVLKEESQIEVFASLLLDEIIQFSFKNNLTGLEWAGGLPSTAGGAIRGNVGAFGSEIKDVVSKVEVFDMATRQIKLFLNEELRFSYRESLVKKNKNLIVVTGLFQLQPADTNTLSSAKEVYKSRIEYRKLHNPVEFPSCGSTFKNIINQEEVQKIIAVRPEVEELVKTKWHGKVAMGYVIKRLGFSGFKIGDAQVSEKHANYIINLGNAKAFDVLSVINRIKEKFHHVFGFYPEEEVEIVY